MIKLLPKRRTPSTILGLTLDGSRLEGVVLRRSNGTLHVQKTFFATLALNPLNADTELMGREIRNHLEQAGVRERRCVVGIPLNLALALQLRLPELPEEDIASFLAIEAERGFPYGPEALSLATSEALDIRLGSSLGAVTQEMSNVTGTFAQTNGAGGIVSPGEGPIVQLRY